MSDSDVKIADKWANKFRPRKFEELVGQDSAVSLMKGIIKTKNVPSALMFHGPYGCGKTTSAWMLARYLNCKTLDACGKCDSCKHSEKDHPDIVDMNGAEQRGIDEVRKLIDKARFLPRYNFRVFILDEIHQWTGPAAETFLKPLESPPAKTIYMLCTSEPQKMKPTVISRCTQVAIDLPTKNDVMKVMKNIAKKKKLDFKDKVLEACVEGSGGHVRDAVSLLEGAYLRHKGDSKIKSDELIKFIVKSGAIESARIGIKILLGMYLDKPKVVSKAVFDITEPIPTINAMIRMNEYLMGLTLNEGGSLPQGLWHTPDNKEFVAQYKKHVQKGSISKMLEVEKKIVETRSRMQAFAVPEKSLMLAQLT